VAAHRAGASAGLADIAPEQQQVDDHLDRRDRMAVLGDAMPQVQMVALLLA
jgi:hypothetical protein